MRLFATCPNPYVSTFHVPVLATPQPFFLLLQSQLLTSSRVYELGSSGVERYIDMLAKIRDLRGLPL